MNPRIYADKAAKQAQYREAVAAGFTKDNGGVKAYRAALAAGTITPPVSYRQALNDRDLGIGDYVNHGWFGQTGGESRVKATHFASPKLDMEYMTACGKYQADVKMVTDIGGVTCGKCRTNVEAYKPENEKTHLFTGNAVATPICLMKAGKRAKRGQRFTRAVGKPTCKKCQDAIAASSFEYDQSEEKVTLPAGTCTGCGYKKCQCALIRAQLSRTVIGFTDAQMRELSIVAGSLDGNLGYSIKGNKLIFASSEEYQRIGKLLIEGLEDRGDATDKAQSDYVRQTRAANNGWANSDEARKKVAEFNGIKKACFGAVWQIAVGADDEDIPDLQDWYDKFRDARSEARYAAIDARRTKVVPDDGICSKITDGHAADAQLEMERIASLPVDGKERAARRTAAIDKWLGAKEKVTPPEPLIHVLGFVDDIDDPTSKETALCGVDIPHGSGTLNYHQATCPDCVIAAKKKGKRRSPRRYTHGVKVTPPLPEPTALDIMKAKVSAVEAMKKVARELYPSIEPPPSMENFKRKGL